MKLQLSQLQVSTPITWCRYAWPGLLASLQGIEIHVPHQPHMSTSPLVGILLPALLAVAFAGWLLALALHNMLALP